MPALTTYIGTRGFIGLAPEATKGTAVAATSWLPLLDGESLKHAPGIVTQKMIRATRAEQSLPYVGEQKVEGKLPTLLFVDQALVPLAQAIGNDTYQTSSAAGTAVSIGASGSGLSAGSGAITVTTQTSTPIAANDYVMIQQASGSPSLSNLSEVHKVQTVTGAGPYVLTFVTGETLNNTYTTSGMISRIASGTTAFTHNIFPDQPNASAYKTFTIEKNIGGLESLQYAGAIVDKLSLKANTKDAVKCDYDIKAYIDNGSVTPSVPVLGTSNPLSLAGYAMSIAGAADTSVTDFSFDLSNGGKEYWTFNTSSMPAVLPPTMRSIKGKWTNIVQNDTYRANSIAGTTFAIAPTFTQGANSVAFNFPKCVITDLVEVLKLGDLVMYDVTWDALYSESSGYDVSATVINSNWLAII